MGRWLFWLLRLAGIPILLLLAVIGIDYTEAWDTLQDSYLPLAFAAFLVVNVALAIRAYRWRVLASGCGLHYERAIDYYAIFYAGWFASWLLPQGVGSAARLAAVSGTGRSFGRGLGAVLLERLCDGGSAALLGLLILPYVVRTGQAMWFGTLLLVICGLIVFIAAAVLLLRRSGQRDWIRLRAESTAIGLRIVEIVDELFAALAAVGPRQATVVAALSLLATSAMAVAFYMAALSIDIHESFLLIVAAYAVVNLTMFLPISVAGLGPREGILIVALVGAGESEEAAVALGLLWFCLMSLSRLPGILGWLHTPARSDNLPSPRLAEH
jgi:uncharacterized protein (TIRG00374 family)